MPGQSRLHEHAFHRYVMDMQLPGDGAAAPLLDVIQSQDLCRQFRRNGHGFSLHSRVDEATGGARSRYGQSAATDSRSADSTARA